MVVREGLEVMAKPAKVGGLAVWSLRGGSQGGRGGAGAGGNGGQGGAGGLSIGIGYSGTAPIVDASTATTVGSLGLGGAGGAAGGGAALMRGPNPGAAGAKGPDGVMQTTPLAL